MRETIRNWWRDSGEDKVARLIIILWLIAFVLTIWLFWGWESINDAGFSLDAGCELDAGFGLDAGFDIDTESISIDPVLTCSESECFYRFILRD